MGNAKAEEADQEVAKPPCRTANVDSYSCLGRELLVYCVPFVYAGWKYPMEAEMVPDLPSRFKVDHMWPHLESVWKQSKEAAARQGGNARPSLLRAYASSVSFLIIKGLLVGSLNGVINSFVRPLLLRQCLLWMADPEGEALHGELLWGGLLLASLLEGWTAVATLRICADEVFAGYSSAISGLICHKAFSASHGEHVGGLMGNDVIRAYENAKQLGFLPLGAASLVGGIAMLFLTIGWACLGGLATMILMFLLNRQVAGRLTGAMRRNLETSSARLAVLDQIVDSSKAVKFFSWEELYLEVLKGKRQAEVDAAGSYRWLMVIAVQIGRATPIFSAAASIACMVVMGMELVAADIFAVISVFMALRLCLIVLPQGYASLKVVCVSVDRIQRFLELPDEEPRRCLPQGCSSAVRLISASLSWPEPAPAKEGQAGAPRVVLADCGLEVPRGELLAVVGPVGAGKTTLLSAVVGVLQPAAGEALAQADIAYAPQQPQVICGTVEENILLGRPRDDAKLQCAIEAAQLAHDLQILDGGLEAEIGERGVSLSGGQKQRISLARTVYGITPEMLLVLDDPVAAVDPKVGRLLVQSIVLAHKRRGGTVVVALNQREHLHHFDRVLEIVEGVVTAVPPPPTPTAEGASRGELDVDAMLEQQGGAEPMSALKSSKTVEIIDEEIQAKGPMGVRLVGTFLRAWGLLRLAVYFPALHLGYALMVGADLWLVRWSQAGSDLGQEENFANLGVYLALVVGYALFVILASRTAVTGCTEAAGTLHQQTMTRMMRAPLSWWDATPKGRITSRFSTDIGLVDTQLGFMWDNLMQLLINLLALSIVVMAVAPIIAPAMVVGFGSLACLFRVVDFTNREVKRFAHRAISPVLSNVAECQQMRLISRMLGCQAFFERRNASHVDEWNRHNFNSNMLQHWSKLMASSVAAVLSAGTSAWLMFGAERDPEKSAIAMSYSIIIPYFLGMCSSVIVITKAQFTSLERVLEYIVLPQEPEWHLPGDGMGELPAWPPAGAVEFKAVSMRYRQFLPLALKDVSFSIPAGARAGIIGRTGSGKSTVMACLFRLHEVESGRVLLDGVDVKSVGLRHLRRRITVVPQDPVLMHGTIRSNLDPFGVAEEASLRRGLRCASLVASEEETDAVLEKELTAGGSNLSCGERQLLCLARAVVQDPKVLLLDEPTSSTDAETDRKLQSMLRGEFACTTLCIAHRIQTIADSDLVLVLRDGQLLEAGSPAELVRMEGGEFRSMVEMTGVQVSGKERRAPPEKLEGHKIRSKILACFAGAAFGLQQSPPKS